MPSDLSKIIDDAPTRSLLMIAAGLVIVCQLVALVMVAGGQVEKAQRREARQASASAATVWCRESSRGAALNDCSGSDASFTAQSGADLLGLSTRGSNMLTSGTPY